MIMEATLIPEKSIGKFVIGDPIDRFLSDDYDFYPKIDEDTSDMYVFYHPTLNVYCDDRRLIISISCSELCVWKGKNLLGMRYLEFVDLVGSQADEFEKIYMIVEGKGQNQMVYDFDAMRLQVWTWRQKIVTVILY